MSGRWATRFAALALGVAVAGVSEASSGVFVDVVRDSESSSCPDATRIFAAVEGLFPQSDVHPSANAQAATLAVLVEIRHTPAGYEALLRVQGQHRGERRITDLSDCSGMAEAVAVAIMLLLEPESPPAMVPPPSRAPEPEPTSARPLRLDLETGFFGSDGWLGRPALGGLVGVGLSSVTGLGLRLRGVRALAQEVEWNPGTIRADLWALLVGACWRLTPRRRVAFLPCLDLGIGRQQASASGFITKNGEASALFLELGPSFTLAVRALAGLDARLMAGIGVNLNRETYTVDAAKALEQPVVGGFLGLGLGSAEILLSQ